MPRIDAGAHLTGSPPTSVAVAEDVHVIRSPLDALSALFSDDPVATDAQDSASELHRNEAAKLLEILWGHCLEPKPCGPLHITCDGARIDITEHPAGLELKDCTSGECRMLYGCDFDGLSRAAAAKVLEVAPPPLAPSEVVSARDEVNAGNLPLELWEEIALHLYNYRDLTALVSTSQQFRQNLGAKARILQLRACWAFERREFATATVLKAVLTLVKPWPYPARFGVLFPLVHPAHFRDDPEALNLLVREARQLPNVDRLRAFIELASIVSPSCRSYTLWRQCAQELRAIPTVDPRDRASAVFALAVGFGKWDTSSAPAKQEDFDALLNEASELGPADQRTVVAALANAAPLLEGSASGEAAWERCAAAIHDLNQTLPSNRGAALFALLTSFVELRPKEARARACLAMLAEFARLDPVDPYWLAIFNGLDKSIHLQLPTPSRSTAFATLQSAVVQLDSGHPYKANMLSRLMSSMFLCRCFDEPRKQQDSETLSAIVEAVATLTPDAPCKAHAVLQVLSTIPMLPADLRTPVWELIYRAVPDAIGTADVPLQPIVNRSLDSAIESLPDQRDAMALPQEAKRPRRTEGGI